MEINIGDKVTLIGRGIYNNGPLKILKVTRCLKKFFELNDGTQWTYDGHQYPRRKGSIYRQPFIVRKTIQEHIDFINFHNNITLLNNWIKGARIKNINQLNQIIKIIETIKD